MSNVTGKFEMEAEDGFGFYNLFERSICQRRFGFITNARLHVLTVHMKKGKRCSTCGWTSFDDQRLRDHIPKCPRKRKRCIQIKTGGSIIKVKVSAHGTKNSASTSRRRQGQGRGGQGQVTRRKSFKTDPGQLKVRNIFPGFDLKTALGVQVMIEPLLVTNLKSEEAGQDYHLQKSEQFIPEENETPEEPQQILPGENEKTKTMGESRIVKIPIENKDSALST